MTMFVVVGLSIDVWGGNQGLWKAVKQKWQQQQQV
jgi:hypothetical protein